MQVELSNSKDSQMVLSNADWYNSASVLGLSVIVIDFTAIAWFQTVKDLVRVSKLWD